MATDIASMSLEDAAKEFAGNWKKFDSFAWHEQPDDAENWGHYILSHRDSDPLSRSNEKAIEKIFKDEQYADDVRFEQHSHWAVGHVSVLTLRAIGPDGAPTAAFEKLYEIAKRLQDYPALDDEAYNEMQFDEQHEAISDSGRYVASGAPDDWVHQVWEWCFDGGYDFGGENWISEEKVAAAALELGFLDPDYALELFPSEVEEIEQLVQSDAFRADDLKLDGAPDDWAGQVLVKTRGSTDVKAVAKALEELGLYYSHGDEPTLPDIDVEPASDDDLTPEEKAIEAVVS